MLSVTDIAWVFMLKEDLESNRFHQQVTLILFFVCYVFAVRDWCIPAFSAYVLSYSAFFLCYYARLLNITSISLLKIHIFYESRLRSL